MPDERARPQRPGYGSPAAKRRQRVLVTGANGFIGSNLCAFLAQDQAVEVVGFVRPTSDLTFLSGLENVEIITGDITDRRSLSAAMQDVSLVYHIAGLVSDWGRWEGFAAANVGGARNVLDEARRNGVRRIVHLSSVSVYGFPGGTDLQEAAPFIPRLSGGYICSKAEGDQLVMEGNGRGIETVVIRPATVYGPCDRTTTLKLAEALTRGRFAYVDRGRHVLAPIYVGNLVELLRLAGECDRAAGQAFNAVDDGQVSWRQFIEWFCHDLGCLPPRLSVPAAAAWPIALGFEAAARVVRAKRSPIVNRFRLRAVMQDNHYSNEKAKRVLGWRPSVSTRGGIRRAVGWYMNLAGRGAEHNGATIGQ